MQMQMQAPSYGSSMTPSMMSEMAPMGDAAASGYDQQQQQQQSMTDDSQSGYGNQQQQQQQSYAKAGSGKAMQSAGAYGATGASGMSTGYGKQAAKYEEPQVSKRRVFVC